MARKIIKTKSKCCSGHKSSASKDYVSHVVNNSNNIFSDTESQRNSGHLHHLMKKAKLALNILQEEQFLLDDSEQVIVMFCTDDYEPAGNYANTQKHSGMHRTRENASSSRHSQELRFKEKTCNNTQYVENGQYIHNFEGVMAECRKPDHISDQNILQNDLFFRVCPHCDNSGLHKGNVFDFMPSPEEPHNSENLSWVQYLGNVCTGSGKSNGRPVDSLTVSDDSSYFQNISTNVKGKIPVLHTKPKRHLQHKSQSHSTRCFQEGCLGHTTKLKCKKSKLLASTEICSNSDGLHCSEIPKVSTESIRRDGVYCSNCKPEKDDVLPKYSKIHTSGSKVCPYSAASMMRGKPLRRISLEDTIIDKQRYKTTSINKHSDLQLIRHAWSHAKQNCSFGPEISDTSSLSKKLRFSPYITPPDEITFDCAKCPEQNLDCSFEEKCANCSNENMFLQRAETECKLISGGHFPIEEHYIPFWLRACKQPNSFVRNEKYSDHPIVNNKDLQFENKLHAEQYRNHCDRFILFKENNSTRGSMSNILKPDSQEGNRKMKIQMPCRETTKVNYLTNRYNRWELLPYRKTHSEVIISKHHLLRYSEFQRYKSEPLLMLKENRHKPKPAYSSPQTELFTMTKSNCSSHMLHNDNNQLKPHTPLEQLQRDKINNNSPSFSCSKLHLSPGSQPERKTLAATVFHKCMNIECNNNSTQENHFCCRETSETGTCSGAPNMTTKSCLCGGQAKRPEMSGSKPNHRAREKLEDDRYIAHHSEPRSFSSLEYEKNHGGYYNDRDTFHHSSECHHDKHRFLSGRKKDHKSKRSSEETHCKWHKGKLNKKGKPKHSSATSNADSSELEDSPPRRRKNKVGKRHSKNCCTLERCPKHRWSSGEPGRHSSHRHSMKPSSSYDYDKRHSPNLSMQHSYHKADDNGYSSSVESPNKYHDDDEDDDSCECGCRCWESPSNTSAVSSVTDYDPDYYEKRSKDCCHQKSKKKSKKKKKKKKNRCSIL